MRFVVLAIGLLLFVLVSSAQKHPAVEYESVKEIKQKALRFIVFGDWGRNGEDNQMEFIVSTGDNFYPNGVRSTRDHNWLASYENIYTAHSLYSTTIKRQ